MRFAHLRNVSLGLSLLLLVSWLGSLTAVAAPAGGTSAASPARFPLPEVTPSQKISKLPNILVIGTGGTIAGKSEDETSFQTYRAGTLLIEDMVGELPHLDRIADVNTYQFGNKCRRQINPVL